MGYGNSTLYNDLAGAGASVTTAARAQADLVAAQIANERNQGLASFEAYTRNRNQSMAAERDAFAAAHPLMDPTQDPTQDPQNWTPSMPVPVVPDHTTPKSYTVDDLTQAQDGSDAVPGGSGTGGNNASGYIDSGLPKTLGNQVAYSAPGAAPSTTPMPGLVQVNNTTDPIAFRNTLGTGIADPVEREAALAAFDKQSIVSSQAGNSATAPVGASSPQANVPQANVPQANVPQVDASRKPWVSSGIGDWHRLLAVQAWRSGDEKQYATAMTAARAADFTDLFNRGVMGTNIPTLIAAANADTNPDGTPNGSPIKIITQKGKDGNPAYDIIVTQPDGSVSHVRTSVTQMQQIAGYRSAMHADPERALAGIAGIDQALATAWTAKLKDQIEIAKSDNMARYQSGMVGTKQTIADAAQVRASGMWESAAARGALAEAAQYRLGVPVNTVDAQGNAHSLIPVRGPDGKVSYSEAPLPAGQRFPKQLPDQKAVEARAEALIGTPTGRPGKETYTAETAYPAAYRMVQNAGSGASPAGATILPNSALEAMRAKAKAAQNPRGMPAGTPGGGPAPQVQNSTGN